MRRPPVRRLLRALIPVVGALLAVAVGVGIAQSGVRANDTGVGGRAERLALIADSFSQYAKRVRAENPGADVPSPLTRIVPDGEVEQDRSDCIGLYAGSSQVDAVIAQYICSTSYLSESELDSVPTASDLRRAWWWRSQVVIPCLASHGRRLTYPTTFAAFRQALLSGDQSLNIESRLSVRAGDDGAVADLLRECPTTPPTAGPHTDAAG